MHGRRSIRLPRFDYTRAGAYFITICAARRVPTFGTIGNGAVKLNSLGEIVREEWLRTAEQRPNVALDEFMIMPDHFHTILFLLSQGEDRPEPRREEFGKPVSGSVPTIIRAFKGSVTRRARGMKVWQRNYYEHVVRNLESLEAIRQYIVDNPTKCDSRWCRLASEPWIPGDHS